MLKAFLSWIDTLYTIEKKPAEKRKVLTADAITDKNGKTIWQKRLTSK